MTETAQGVSLQINVAPVDLPHARPALEHQLRQWAGQVDEVVFTLDLHRSPGRRGEGYDERRPGIERLLEELSATHPHARTVVVDYGPDAAAPISAEFFGGGEIPTKDAYGAPFYAYFFGLAACAHRHILHLDSDLMFGGGSQTWIAEAVDLLAAREDVLFCGPLPGPPAPGGTLPPHVVERHSGTQRFGTEPIREDVGGRLAYRFGHMSSRLFLFDRQALVAALGPLTPFEARKGDFRPDEGHPPFVPAETMLSGAMADRGLARVDFLGEDPGVWTLHPAYRTETFYAELPSIIARVEAGDVPEGQLGDYELNDSMIDWSSAYAAMRRPLWKRAARRALGRR